MKSVWIFLQPSDKIHRRLGEWITSHLIDDMGASGKKMSLHIAVLGTASQCWAEYIEGLRAEIQELVFQTTHVDCV